MCALVTGVQTCALPISSRTGRERNAARADARSVNRGEARHAAADTILPHLCDDVPPTGPAFRQITRFCLARRLCARDRLATRNRLISAPVMCFGHSCPIACAATEFSRTNLAAMPSLLDRPERLSTPTRPLLDFLKDLRMALQHRT